MTLAGTPPMGWNSWNTFGRNINESLIKEIADTLVESGLRDLGYVYLNLDDHWHGGRAEDGRPQPNFEKFPNGLKVLGDYIHERGLKFGIYSDAADNTCGGEFGSLGYEEIDAQTWAEWGVDYLKYDYCHAPLDRGTAIARYRKMGQALRATGRPIVYSVCEWGDRQPWLWAREVGANLWRTSGDIWDGWEDGPNHWQLGIDRIGFEIQRGLERYAGPGHWNDPDMLIVGMGGSGNVSHQNGCSYHEYRSHFSLWSLLAAPLLIGCDIRNMSADTREILTNAEVIALNQDSLGQQGYRVFHAGKVELFKKPLLFGELGVGVFNRRNEAQTLRVHWSDLGIQGAYQVRDLWAHTDMGVFDEGQALVAELEPHACAIYRLSPA